ncbi:Zinc finger C3HC4-type RING finger family protein [Quillaja saponaria]|uniref:Zinc finger C3HC4-type RING finger family protein n=1 Tax=Quillaja saponaria TaxID=32244 RepID=A0AAD7KQD8_QUISA|nr:Zinc finger C3HC4-type RING finger family protein [Quillaja saponaria]
MVTGWRRVFCTSIPKERETKVLSEKQQHCDSTKQSPKISSKFGFFSNPSTPRLQSQPVSSPSLRCRTTVATNTPTSSVPNSPKLQCKISATQEKNNSPRLFQLSNPSSPKSPSSFSLLKNSLRLSKSVKTGQGTAIFTAECSHTFHFPCIAAHIKKQQFLFCPVCSTNWKELPLLVTQNDNQLKPANGAAEKNRTQNPVRDVKIKSLRVYDDDEPLMSPTSVARFNPIPESDENEEDQQHNGNIEFQGFRVNPSGSSLSSPRGVTYDRNIEVRVSPEAAILAVGRSYETYAVILKIKAPPSLTVNSGGRGRTPRTAARRAPIDLVTVIDVSGAMTDSKLQMVKRSMRLVISSLSPTDRLSIIAFSSSSKRLFPLRRMTSNGQRSARRIVDTLVTIDQGREATVKNDAVKKAAKVLEDRRQKNSVASIVVLSDGPSSNQKGFLISTRFAHMEVPVHSVGFADGRACANAPPEEALVKCVGGLLSVVVHDLRLKLSVVSRSGPVEIAAVYSSTVRPTALGSGLIRLSDLYAEEERELLVELKVPSASIGSHHVLTVGSFYKDPSSQEVVYSKEQAVLLPRPQAARSSDPKIERLRNLHVTTRAVAESRLLIQHNDLSGAHHLLSSARALLIQSSRKTADEHLHCLEAEQAELQRRRQQQLQNQRQGVSNNRVDEKVEPLTPTSAWRAAERLAKVAIMRKHMNRVSDLHGFENARF